MSTEADHFSPSALTLIQFLQLFHVQRGKNVLFTGMLECDVFLLGDHRYQAVLLAECFAVIMSDGIWK